MYSIQIKEDSESSLSKQPDESRPEELFQKCSSLKKSLIKYTESANGMKVSKISVLMEAWSSFKKVAEISKQEKPSNPSNQSNRPISQRFISQRGFNEFRSISSLSNSICIIDDFD